VDKASKTKFDAAVQAEVARQMMAMQAQFAQAMQRSVQSGLQGIDGASAALADERAAVAAELDAVQELRRAAEREGEKMAEEYFQKSRQMLVEFTRTEQKRDLARAHLLAGRGVDEICLWLDVEPEFVERIVEVLDRVAEFRRTRPASETIDLPGSPQVKYRQEGRGITVIYENGPVQFELWAEGGMGSALLLIDVPPPDRWRARTTLPEEERRDVLRFIAERVMAEQARSGSGYEVGDAVITIFR